MNICMSGLDWQKAPIGLREALSFTRGRVLELNRQLRGAEGVEGCVLLSTCNRTELYLSCAEGAEPEPGALLCAAAGISYAPFAGAFVTRRGAAAARHLMEVAGGLRSQISVSYTHLDVYKRQPPCSIWATARSTRPIRPTP